MTAERSSARLGDHIDLLVGFAFKSSQFRMAPPGIRLVRGDNVSEGRLRWDGKARYWPTLTEELRRFLLQPGDVLIGMDGSKVGRNWAQVRESELPLLLVQRVACLRARETLDQGFLAALIASELFKAHVNAVRTGSSIPHISGGQIGEFTFMLPPLAEQRAIARTLGSIDQKIDLNRRMSETFDALARTLFKSWFVEFRPVRAKAEGRDPDVPRQLADPLPATFEHSDVGEIPTGWEVRGLDEIARFLNGLALQKYPPAHGRSIPVIKIAQLRAGHTDGADVASEDLPPAYIVDDSDVLFSWSGSLECVVWAGGRGALNQHLFKVSSDDFPKWFYYLWTHEHLDDFRRVAAGKATTMGHIQRHHLSDAKVVVPPRSVLQVADGFMAPLLDGMWLRAAESRTLGKIRDILLPKLISGELRVREAQRMLQAIPG